MSESSWSGLPYCDPQADRNAFMLSNHTPFQEKPSPSIRRKFCKGQMNTLSHRLPHDAGALLGPRAPFGAPVRKPFLARRPIVLRKRHRPEPVVFLRLAFSLQLSARHSQGPLQDWPSDVHFRMLAAGYPQAEHVCFWMWRDRRPGQISHALQHLEVRTNRSDGRGCVFCCGACRNSTFPSLSGC
jgi:hypothetical protein